MKVTIDRKVYNTDTAEFIERKNYGAWGDVDGYSEDLMKTKTGNYFIYGIGGTQSIYKEPTIKTLSQKEVTEWKKI